MRVLGSKEISETAGAGGLLVTPYYKFRESKRIKYFFMGGGYLSSFVLKTG